MQSSEDWQDRITDRDQYAFRRSEDGRSLIVQHRVTGLRAKFTTGIIQSAWADADPHATWGGVNSNPEHVFSIDDASSPYPEEFQRRGVGRQLYLLGAAEFPHVRWLKSATTDAGVGIRRALHRDDPYRWQEPNCPVCGGDEHLWELARCAADLPPHPPRHG